MRYNRKRVRNFIKFGRVLLTCLCISAFVIALALVDEETKNKCTDYYFTDAQAICK